MQSAKPGSKLELPLVKDRDSDFTGRGRDERKGNLDSPLVAGNIGSGGGIEPPTLGL